MTTLQTITLTGLLGTWLYEQTIVGEKYKDLRETSKLILLLASIQYIGTLATRGRTVSEQLRYADWLLTTPLLLRMVYLYALERGNLSPEERDRLQSTFFTILVADVAMIVTGYLANYVTPQYKAALTTLSFGFLVLVLGWIYQLRQQLLPRLTQEEQELFSVISSFFFFLWPLYGVASILREEVRTNVYSLLDLMNKAVFSILFLRLVDLDPEVSPST